MRHLAPKAATSQNNGKKVNLPPVSGAKNEVSRQPITSQVTSKAQLMKQTRDYSFLLSDDVDVPKPNSDPGQAKNLGSKPDSRPAQVPGQSNRPSGHSSRKALNGHEQRKPYGTPQVCSTRTAPVRKSTSDDRTSNVSSDSRRQQELRKLPQLTKQMGSATRTESVRPSTARSLPLKKPSSLTDKKMLVEKKAPVPSVGYKDRAPPVSKQIVPNGKILPVEKSRAPGVLRSQERNMSVQPGRERVLNANGNIQVNLPKQSSLRANLDKDRTRAQKPHSQSNSVKKDLNPRKRRAEDVDDAVNISNFIKSLFRREDRYVDYDDDDDDKCMEVGFDTILKEESRSARIARKEDEEEYAKIMEEERRERLRKEAKMRKMSQR
ncbi:hypothetical protein RND81_02G143000 [Saponaria officinalis]|uniref:Protein SPT2 homolog n=2 Tax=Saponaria officinalis TaxID=3572 RepID=A0AAW1MXZ3_SAPOF